MSTMPKYAFEGIFWFVNLLFPLTTLFGLMGLGVGLWNHDMGLFIASVLVVGQAAYVARAMARHGLANERRGLHISVAIGLLVVAALTLMVYSHYWFGMVLLAAVVGMIVAG